MIDNLRVQDNADSNISSDRCRLLCFSEVIYKYGYDTLDMGYFHLEMLHHRVRDGIHCDAFVNRRMVNVLLTHISIAFRKAKPKAGTEVRNFEIVLSSC